MAEAHAVIHLRCPSSSCALDACQPLGEHREHYNRVLNPEACSLVGKTEIKQGKAQGSCGLASPPHRTLLKIHQFRRLWSVCFKSMIWDLTRDFNMLFLSLSFVLAGYYTSRTSKNGPRLSFCRRPDLSHRAGESFDDPFSLSLFSLHPLPNSCSTHSSAIASAVRVSPQKLPADGDQILPGSSG